MGGGFLSPFGVKIVYLLSNSTKQGHFLQFPVICLGTIRSGQGLCLPFAHPIGGRSRLGEGQRVFKDTGTGSGWSRERSGAGREYGKGRTADRQRTTAGRGREQGRQTHHSRTATAKRQKISTPPSRSDPPYARQVGFGQRAAARTAYRTQTLKTPAVKNCTFAL